MRVVLTLLLLCSVSCTVLAQADYTDRRKIFIGITIGPSYPVGNFKSFKPNGRTVFAGPGVFSKEEIAPKSGARLNLINFGFRVSKYIGFAVKWYGAAHGVKSNSVAHLVEDNEADAGEYTYWSYGGILVGPLVTIPVNEKFEIDFRPLFGTCNIIQPEFETKHRKAKLHAHESIAFSLGLTGQYNFADRFGLHSGLEFFSANIYENEKVVDRITTLSPFIGLVYRFN